MCKRILFFTYYECFPKLGGTERTTSLVSQSLSKEYGYECYSAFLKYPSKDMGESSFENKFQVDPSDTHTLAEFIDTHRIDYIVNQGVQTLTQYFEKSISQASHPCKLIFVIHFVPGDFERLYFTFPYLCREYVRTRSKKMLAALLAYPLSKRAYFRLMKKKYAITATNCDKIVLLSDCYRSAWAEISGVKDDENKVVAIPNGLSFSHFACEEEISGKEKRVVIVSRLQENPKNILSALRIWQRLAKDSALRDWSLDIVGDGIDRKRYEQWVAKNKLERVKFHGYADPLKFYQRSSLFMMTSLSEGWGMTLLEASQMGCVPIAFDSYAALADILTNGINGRVVPVGDEDAYAEAMKELMLDSDKRCEIARRAVENSHRFEMHKIAASWHNLLENT